MSATHDFDLRPSADPEQHDAGVADASEERMDSGARATGLSAGASREGAIPSHIRFRQAAMDGAPPAREIDDTPTVQLTNAEPPQIEAGDPVKAPTASHSLLSCRYFLEEEIGRGSYSVVFRARDLRPTPMREGTAELVAIKQLRAEQRGTPWARARLAREFQQLHRLCHPGIVRVFDLHCDADACFMSMEFIAGQTVSKWMQTQRDLSAVLKLLESCCAALAHAHEAGVAHGDLKPTNVMVLPDGTAKLIDFGSALSATEDATARPAPDVTATLLYASPQVLAGKRAEPRDDVFSLACIVYAILTGGRHPFGGHPSLEDGRAKSAPNHPQAIPHRLFEVLARALSAELRRRPASAREFLEACTEAVHLESARMAPPEPVAAAHELTSPPQVLSADRDLVALASASERHRPHRAWLAGQLFVLVAAIAAAIFVSLSGAPQPVARAVARSPVAVAPRPLAKALPAPPAAAARIEPASSPGNFGSVSFDTPAIEVNAAQPLVAISVKRSEFTDGPGSFVWRVKSGSARPGVDYQEARPQRANFLEGQAVRTLFIPLINTGAAAGGGRGPRSFTVVLERTAGGPALGRFARVRVTIDPARAWQSAALYPVGAQQR
jgi:predicted Ser/Thr protein kinase